jgi:hypothetical protein
MQPQDGGRQEFDDLAAALIFRHQGSIMLVVAVHRSSLVP